MNSITATCMNDGKNIFNFLGLKRSFASPLPAFSSKKHCNFKLKQNKNRTSHPSCDRNHQNFTNASASASNARGKKQRGRPGQTKKLVGHINAPHNTSQYLIDDYSKKMRKLNTSNGKDLKETITPIHQEDLDMIDGICVVGGTMKESVNANDDQLSKFSTGYSSDDDDGDDYDYVKETSQCDFFGEENARLFNLERKERWNKEMLP